MDVEIQTVNGILLLESIDKSSTIKNLKNEIKIQRDTDFGNDVYYMGYLVQDDELVADYMDVGNKAFTVLKSKPSNSQNQQKQGCLISEMTAQTFIRGPHDFKSLSIFPNKQIKFKNKFQKFGIVSPINISEFNQEKNIQLSVKHASVQEDSLKRIVHVYENSEAGNIELRSKIEGEAKVFLIPDNPDQPEKELMGVRKEYNETKILATTEKVVKRAIIAKNAEKIANLIYGETSGSSKQKDSAFWKTFECSIDVEYKEREEYIKGIQERVKNIVLDATKSVIDLNFVKGIILEEHTEEIVSLDFEDLDLANLPWDSMIFDVVGIRKGSAFLKFNLGFKKRPTNQDELNTYRLIELVVLTIIENLHFIDRIEKTEIKENGDNLILTANIKAHTFDADLVKDTLNSLRGGLLLISGKEVDGASLSDEKVNDFLKELLHHKSKEVRQLMDLEMSPLSMRRIAEAIKKSKITEKDIANITFDQLDTSIKKNKCQVINTSPNSNWLFPFNFRKLSDLEPEKFNEMITLTRNLPEEKRLWNKSFLLHLDVYIVSHGLIEHRSKLARDIDQIWPYQDILIDYKNHEGTLGGLLKAFEQFKKEVDDAEKNSISQFVNVIMNVRTTMFDNILGNVFCPSPVPSVRNIEDFEKMSRIKGLKVKTNPMDSFKRLKEHLKPGDQLWIFRQSRFIRSYAHVVIFVGEGKFIHTNAPNLKTKSQAKAVIKVENQSTYENERSCFVVHEDTPAGREADIFSKRAEICEGIRFDYDLETTNCETFCNGVHGKWEPNVMGKDLRGISKMTLDAAAKSLHWMYTYIEDEKLHIQMLRKFKEKGLVFPKENEILKKFEEENSVPPSDPHVPADNL